MDIIPPEVPVDKGSVINVSTIHFKKESLAAYLEGDEYWQ